MNLLVNSLPAKTWNRLGMNSSSVLLEGQHLNKEPIAKYNKNEVLWVSDAEKENITLPVGAPSEYLEAVKELHPQFAETGEGVKMKEPLILTYDYKDGEKAASRLILHAKKGSNLKVLLSLKDEGASSSLIQVEIYADEESTVDIYTSQLLGSSSLCLNNIGGLCGEKAKINLTKLDLGAGKLYAGAVVDLRGDESEFNSKVGYHAKADQLVDMNFVSLHKGRHTSSLMEADGTLEEGSKKIFRGTIDFQRGCIGSKGTESENVLLLGEKLVNQTIPIILCTEDDVEGNHGASIGRLDDKVIFYLGSRGIKEEDAQQMIALSRIKSICALLPDEEVRNEVEKFEEIRGISYEKKL